MDRFYVSPFLLLLLFLPVLSQVMAAREERPSSLRTVYTVPDRFLYAPLPGAFFRHAGEFMRRSYFRRESVDDQCRHR